MLLLIKYTLLYGIVLMLVALGGMFSEHSGIINIALEGIMVIGGVAGVLTLTVLPESLSPFLVVLISILVAALAGVVYSLLLAFASINLKADQTIGGTALNLLATAVAVVISKNFSDSGSAKLNYSNKPFLFSIGGLELSIFVPLGIALLIIVVYALPPLKVVLPYRTCVIVATVLLGSAFGSENFMSGINTVGVGQVEAARSLGMSFNRILAKIVIPQALRSSVLPMTNLFIAVMLTTALGSQVPLKPQELTGVVSYINTRSLGGVAAFFISALGYLGTAFVVSHIGNYIDKKVRILR